MQTQQITFSLDAEELQELGVTNKDMQSLLGYSYTQAYRILQGQQKMNVQAAELLLLKLGKHPLLKVMEK